MLKLNTRILQIELQLKDCLYYSKKFLMPVLNTDGVHLTLGLGLGLGTVSTEQTSYTID